MPELLAWNAGLLRDSQIPLVARGTTATVGHVQLANAGLHAIHGVKYHARKTCVYGRMYNGKYTFLERILFVK